LIHHSLDPSSFSARIRTVTPLDTAGCGGAALPLSRSISVRAKSLRG
jgi:hypothetical protein